MKDEILNIYSNSYGISFKWKYGVKKNKDKVQMVFRDTGLLLTRKELIQFSKNIQCTLNGEEGCHRCNEEDCRSLLLDTPAPQISLAVSKRELGALEDLVEGTLFQMDLDTYLNNICEN